MTVKCRKWTKGECSGSGGGDGGEEVWLKTLQRPLVFIYIFWTLNPRATDFPCQVFRFNSKRASKVLLGSRVSGGQREETEV